MSSATSQADRVLSPLNDDGKGGRIGVYSLTAGVATAALDMFPIAIVPAQAGRWCLTVIADAPFYVALGDATVHAPVTATTGALGTIASDGRCWGPIPASFEWRREIGPESRFLRVISAFNCLVRVYISSPGPFGQLPG